METELLKIYSEDRKPLGVATREEVHRLGYWHETFHCWIIGSNHGRHDIYLQIRSKQKKDYPNLLDITAAGHILADETIKDGIRELKEELGIQVKMEDLTSLGVLEYRVSRKDFIDKEIAHVFLYDQPLKMDDYTLQQEEVIGIVKADFHSFHDLWMGIRNEIVLEGFKSGPAGRHNPLTMTVDKTYFVPHYDYFKQIAGMVKKHLYK